MVVRQEKLYEKVKHLMQEGDVTNSFLKIKFTGVTRTYWVPRYPV